MWCSNRRHGADAAPHHRHHCAPKGDLSCWTLAQTYTSAALRFRTLLSWRPRFWFSVPRLHYLRIAREAWRTSVAVLQSPCETYVDQLRPP
eukprot:3837911-Amphidinium_carterae.1